MRIAINVPASEVFVVTGKWLKIDSSKVRKSLGKLMIWKFMEP